VDQPSGVDQEEYLSCLLRRNIESLQKIVVSQDLKGIALTLVI